jgi:hypothetical protein
MDCMNFGSLKTNQKTSIKTLAIFGLILAILLLVSGSGLAEASTETLTQRAGTIDQFRDDDVVVDDCNFKLAPDVKFYTNSKMTTYANRSRFRKGTYVGYQINQNGQVTTMWLEKK